MHLVGLEPWTFGSSLLYLTTTLITNPQEKSFILFLFHETSAGKMIASRINRAINSEKTM